MDGIRGGVYGVGGVGVRSECGDGEYGADSGSDSGSGGGDGGGEGEVFFKPSRVLCTIEKHSL